MCVEAVNVYNDCNKILHAICDTVLECEGISYKVITPKGDISPTAIYTNGFSELYCFYSSAEKSASGNIFAVSPNKNKSASNIYIPLLSPKSLYRGHDKFSIKTIG